MSLKGKKIIVTGGSGFLGSYVVEKLKKNESAEVIVPRSNESDLRDRFACKALLQKIKPDIIIHLAATVGGIGANKENPGKFFYDNLSMGIHLMEEARLANVQKFVTCGTICSYPKDTPVPFKEEYLWEGYPEETNAPYGLAKKMLLVQSQTYREQYGLNAIYLLPVNLYGPKDNFDLKTSHVVAALIRKFLEAKENGNDEITVWGTGKATREFLFVEDAADAIILATKKYNEPQPVNLGTGEEFSIKELVTLIAQKTGFSGKINWDSNKPDGQLRRCLDISKAKLHFGFEAKTSLNEGLDKTISWYKNQYINKKDSK